MENEKCCAPKETENPEQKKQALQNGISMGVDDNAGLIIIALNLNGQSVSMPMTVNEAAGLHNTLANCISHVVFAINQQELKRLKEEQDKAQAEAQAEAEKAQSNE